MGEGENSASFSYFVARNFATADSVDLNRLREAIFWAWSGSFGVCESDSFLHKPGGWTRWLLRSLPALWLYDSICPEHTKVALEFPTPNIIKHAVNGRDHAKPLECINTFLVMPLEAVACLAYLGKLHSLLPLFSSLTKSPELFCDSPFVKELRITCLCFSIYLIVSLDGTLLWPLMRLWVLCLTSEKSFHQIMCHWILRHGMGHQSIALVPCPWIKPNSNYGNTGHDHTGHFDPGLAFFSAGIYLLVQLSWGPSICSGLLWTT